MHLERRNGVYTIYINGIQTLTTSAHGTANFTTPAYVRIG
jgi:hypothetical protein